MKEKKTIVLAVVLLALVGVYAFYSYKSEQRKKPTGKAAPVTSLTPEQEMQKKVIHAIKNYKKDTTRVPHNLEQLKGKYLDEKTYNLTMAKGVQYTFVNDQAYRISFAGASSSSVKLAKKTADTKMQPGGKQSADTASDEDKSKTLTTSDTGWKYDPTGKPDPFKPFILASAATEETPVVVHRQLTPLQKMPLSEIQAGLKAIIWGQLGSKALVEDATGKGYVVQEGTYVGQHDGIVKKIYQDRIIVEEYRRDTTKGRLEPTEVVLKLKKVERE